MCLQHNPEIPDTGVHLKVDEAVEGRTRKEVRSRWLDNPHKPSVRATAPRMLF